MIAALPATYGAVDEEEVAARSLASQNYIVEHDSLNAYRLNEKILRQEAVGVAVKIYGLSLLDGRECMGYYSDLTAMMPNDWACVMAEAAADVGLVTRANATFRPEDYVTRSEALAIIISSRDEVEPSEIAGVPISRYEYEKDAQAWQEQVVANAYAAGIIDTTEDFGVNINASRGEVMLWAYRMINPDKRLER